MEVLLVAFVHFKWIYILSNKNYRISNTTVVKNMNKNKIYLKNYGPISEDVKFATNSVVRLKIMATLYKEPQNMKSLNERTGLNYSSISSGMHDLELKDYVYRENNKYHLSNRVKFQIKAILEFDEMMTVLDEKSGLLGISGITGDIRDLKGLIAEGNEKAKLAKYKEMLETTIQRLNELKN